MRRSSRRVGLLCYLLPAAPFVLWRGAAHPMVRFHAWQSLLLFIVVAILNVALLLLTTGAYRYSWEAGLQTSAVLRWVYWFQFGLWLFMLHIGYTLEHLRLPWIGTAAEQLACLDENRSNGDGSPPPHAGPATKLPMAQSGPGSSPGL